MAQRIVVNVPRTVDIKSLHGDNIISLPGIAETFYNVIINLHNDFPGMESKLSNSMTFQLFQDLNEPCISKKLDSIQIRK